MKIRETIEADLPNALALNNANVPELNELDLMQITALHRSAVASLTADIDDAFAGFCLVYPPGLEYASMNYRWFSDRYERFVYLDRIAVHPDFRRFGVGRAFYAELVRTLSAQWPVLLCEVNLRPRNEASLLFHQRIGFREVGQQHTDGGNKTVSLLELDLSSAAVL